MSEHTKEQWKFAWQNNHELQMSFACVVIGNNIVVIGHGAEAEANARRIVACVNACGGMTTEEIENDIAVGGYSAIVKCHQAHIEEVEQQRDELLAALEELSEHPRWGDDNIEAYQRWINSVARAAIAKVKGRT